MEDKLPLPVRLRHRVLTAPPGMQLVPGGGGTFVQLLFIFFRELVGHERPRPSVLAHRGLYRWGNTMWGYLVGFEQMWPVAGGRWPVSATRKPSEEAGWNCTFMMERM